VSYFKIAGAHRRLDGWQRPTVASKAPFFTIADDLQIPTRVISPYIPSTQDQGLLGTCTAQTACEVLTGLGIKSGHGEIDYSALYNYFYSRAFDGTSSTDDSGASVESAFKVVEVRGAPRKVEWDDNRPFSLQPPPVIDTYAALHRSLLSFSLPSLLTIKASIALGFGVGFGFQVPSQMMGDDCASTGLVEFPDDPNGSNVWDGGGHAVSVWGYDDAKQIGKTTGAFYCLNHWSSRWGCDGGRFWLPYRYWEADFASDAHTIRLTHGV
jgi:hypothetical protein